MTLLVSEQLPPRKIAPQLGLGFELRLELGIGLGCNYVTNDFFYQRHYSIKQTSL